MAILMDTYRVLGHAVDFQRDIQTGDSFSLGYEILDDGDLGPQHPGSLVYASLTLGERTLSIHRYTTRDGYTGFFDTAGRSIETRSEEHTSELQSLMRNSYAVFCLKKQTNHQNSH